MVKIILFSLLGGQNRNHPYLIGTVGRYGTIQVWTTEFSDSYFASRMGLRPGVGLVGWLNSSWD